MSNLNYYVLSDLHMGYGHLQDFTNESDLVAFLNEKREGDVVIFNGDTFDFVQTPCLKNEIIPKLSVPGHPIYGPTEEESCQKFALIVKQHRNIFDALKACHNRGVAIHFIAGNHDADLLWPKVETDIVSTINGNELSPRITIYKEFLLSSNQGCSTDVGIFHGHQQAGPANLFKDWDTGPFIKDKQGILHLEQPWGSRLLMCLVNKLDKDFPYIDNIKPFSRFLKVCWRTNERALAILVRLIWSHLIDIAGNPEEIMITPEDLQAVTKLGDISSIDDKTERWIDSVLCDAQSELVAGLIGSRAFLEIIETYGSGIEATTMLKSHASSMIKSNHGKLIICGHTHEPILESLKCGVYLNTGCWIPRLKDSERYFYHWDPTIVHPGQLEFYARANSQYFESCLTYATFSHNSATGLSGMPELKLWT